MSRVMIPRRPMTADEASLARAVCPSRVRYVPGSGDKRFASSMASQAAQPAPLITDRQAEYLITLAIRMRRQLPTDVLAIAERRVGRPLPPPSRPRAVWRAPHA